MSEGAPRLYLITPVIADAESFAASFEAALDAGDIACVYLRVDLADSARANAHVRMLAPLAQKRGVACLVGDPSLAAHTAVDGIHVERIGPTLDAALAAMQPDRIVGAGGLHSRDDAMHAGELGVDYLMFGAPWETYSLDQIRDSVAWWAEIFTTPCVAYARALQDVGELAATGAEFIAFADAVWDHPRGPAAAVEAARHAANVIAPKLRERDADDKPGAASSHSSRAGTRESTE